MPSSSIHILGIGNLGKFLAHSLRKHHPNLSITLLFHRPTLIDEWKQAGESIEIIRNATCDRQTGFQYELVNSSTTSTQIDNLIVATKTHSTVQALRPLMNRLKPTSTMLFVQNGIGTVDEVSKYLFPTTKSRPKYLTGIVNHGVYNTSPFSSVHAGFASAFIGRVQCISQDTSSPSKPPSLAEDIITCPELSASFVSQQEITNIQLQKLTINAVINPLTAIFDCYNGELFQSPVIQRLIDQLISEISVVILAILESQHYPLDPDILARFSTGNLTKVVYGVGEQTAKNISSMRQDMLAGRETEINYINGYLVAQALKLRVPCPVNRKIVQLIKDKRKIPESEIGNRFTEDVEQERVST